MYSQSAGMQSEEPMQWGLELETQRTEYSRCLRKRLLAVCKELYLGYFVLDLSPFLANVAR